MPFEPFAVQCTTCGSRLRVTDPSIVGGIASCPKCQSMVQIDRPSDQQLRAGTSSIDSQAITEDAIDARDPSGGPNFRGEQPAEAPSGFAGPVPPADDGAAPDGRKSDSGVSVPMPGAPPIGEEAWQSDRTRRTRQIALVTTLSVSVLTVAALLFVGFVRSYQRQADRPSEPVPTVNQSSTDEGETQIVAPETGVEPENETEPEKETEPVTQSMTKSETDPEAPIGTDPAPPADAMNTIPADLIPTSPIDDPTDDPIDDPTASPMDNSYRKTGDQGGVIENDPAKVFPDGGDDEVGLLDLPVGLEQFAPVLLDDGPPTIENLAAPPSMDDMRLEGAADPDLELLDLEDPEPLNLKADLAIDLVFRTTGYPLSDWTLLISEMTGVPIQIDWVSFDLAGVDIRTKVASPKGAMSARQILDHVAEHVGGEIREEETLVVLTLSDQAFAQATVDVMDMSDFGDAESAMGVVQEFMATREPNAEAEPALGEQVDAPENGIAVDDVVDPGEVVKAPMDASADRQAQQLTVLATDTLRRMRGLPGKLPDGVMKHWSQIGSDTSTQWSPLDGGVALTSDVPIAMAGWLRRLGRRNQTVPLVNWYDALRRGMTPKRLMLPGDAADAAEMLDQTFSPMRLEVRRIDDGHWWVGNVATYDRLPIVIGTEPLGENAEAFRQQLNAIMAGADSQSYRIAIDPVSGRGLVMLPRFVAVQLPKVVARLASN